MIAALWATFWMLFIWRELRKDYWLAGLYQGSATFFRILGICWILCYIAISTFFIWEHLP